MKLINIFDRFLECREKKQDIRLVWRNSHIKLNLLKSIYIGLFFNGLEVFDGFSVFVNKNDKIFLALMLKELLPTTKDDVLSLVFKTLNKESGEIDRLVQEGIRFDGFQVIEFTAATTKDYVLGKANAYNGCNCYAIEAVLEGQLSTLFLDDKVVLSVNDMVASEML